MLKLMRFLSVIAIFTILFGCSDKPTVSTGNWSGVIDLQGKPLPFSFSIKNDPDGLSAILYNGGEEFLLDEVTLEGDSIRIVFHIFDSELRARLSDDHMTGFFTKNFAKNYKLPFTAQLENDDSKHINIQMPVEDFSGRYAMTFIHNETDTTIGIGIFEQTKHKLSGTILTPTGDYRYLEGEVANGEMSIHTFDGEHLFVFTATKKNDATLMGEFRSGMTWFEPWVGIKNSNATLPSSDSITLLKDGYTTIDFSFPDMDGNLISPSDDRFKNKVVILQLFGTWCPNCMDETRFLSSWYNANHDKDVTVLGLAYEQKADYEYGKSRILKMKERLQVPYDFVLAGTSDKEEASKTLPMLNQVIAFPTLIFVGRDGNVKKIHTGFTGPGTGVYYDEFKKEFENTVSELLNEEVSR